MESIRRSALDEFMRKQETIQDDEGEGPNDS